MEEQITKMLSLNFCQLFLEVKDLYCKLLVYQLFCAYARAKDEYNCSIFLFHNAKIPFFLSAECII